MNLYKFLYWLQKKEFYLWLENDSLKFKQTQQLKNKEKVFLLLKSQKENIIKILKKNNIFSSNIKYPFIYKTDKTEAILSSAQERLFFLDQLEQGTNAYNIPYLLKLKKTIFPDIFVKAIKAVIDTNLILKTVYIEKQNSFIQQPLMKELEINSFTPENSKEFNSLLKNKFDYIFDLKNEFPIKVDVLEYNNSTFISLVFHHIAFDGWSTDIFFNEVEANYIKLTNPQQKCKDSSDNHSIQYKDFAVWQKNYITNNYLQEQLKFWKAYLEDYDNLNFPTDKKRPNNFNYKGNYTSINIPSNILDFFKTTAKNNNTSLFCTLLTTYYIFLYKYTGQNDIVIGTPFANRHINGTENIIGFFINTLPIRMNIDSNSTFQELIIKVNNHLEKIQKNQDIPFEQIVNSIDPEKDLSRTPIYQTTFAVHEKNDNKNQYYNFIGTEKFERTSKFDLDLTIIINNNTATIFFNYSTELFTRSYIKQISNHYIHLLSTLATSNHKQQIKDICLLTKEEYQTVVYDWNKTDFQIPSNLSVYNLFEKFAKDFPDKIAIEFKNKKITFKQLLLYTNNLANHLLEFQPIDKRYTIGLYINNSCEMILGILSIFKIGATYLPLSPDYPEKDLSYKLTNSNCNLILTSGILANSLQKKLLSKTKLIVIEKAITIKQKSPINSNYDKTISYIIYTSGSTGSPKGVLVSQKSLINMIFDRLNMYIFSKNERILLFNNFVFDASLEQILISLCSGNTLFVPNKEIKSSFEVIENYLILKKITHFDTVPSFLQGMKISNNYYIKRIIVGGEKCPLNVIKKWNKYFDVFNNYGPTETTINATSNKYLRGTIKNYFSIGKPVLNSKSYILDNDLNPVPLYSYGNLYISGRCLSNGYINSTSLNAEKYIENPFEKNLKMYNTGDICTYTKNGTIEFIGRKDSQIKINGLRIEIEEIESNILKFNNIESCSVIINISNNGNKSLIAFYTLKIFSNIEVFEKKLKFYLSKSLPEFMVPNNFIFLNKMPLNTSGKIDKTALSKLYLSNKHNIVVKPENKLEEKLTTLWQKLLGVKTIGVTEDFFKLGGDSILCLQLVSKLKAINLNCSVKDIFEFRTIRKLTSFLENNHKYKNKILIEQGVLEGYFGLLPIQKNFFDTCFYKDNHWNQSFLIKVPELDTLKLEKCLARLVEHHDMLRTVFPKKDKQKYLHKIDIPKIKVQDVSNISRNNLQNLLTDWQSNFDIQNGPLWCIGYLHGYQDKSARIFFAAHHLIIDVVSWRIITEDLKTLYNNGELEKKTTSFRQWVEVTSKYKQQNNNEYNYWKSILEKSENLTLPTTNNFNNSVIIFSKKVTNNLLRKANNTYNTKVIELLLSALIISISKSFMVTQTTITLEGHGRENINNFIDTSHTLGWFTTLFPISLKNFNNIKQTIKNTKDAFRNIPNNGIGFGFFENYLKLPKITFNYLGQISNSDNYWEIVDENSGINIPQANNNNAFDIIFWVSNSKLTASINNSIPKKKNDTFLNVLKNTINELENHCMCSNDQEYFSAFDGFTPYIKIKSKIESDNLFIFPPGIGGAEAYFKIFEYSNKINKNLYIFNNLLLYMNEKQISNKLKFNKLTSLYYNELLNIQSNKPFNLLGWCLGGITALELAINLLISGYKVKKVIIIDSFFDIKSYTSEKEIKNDPILLLSYSPQQLEKLFSNTDIILFKSKLLPAVMPSDMLSQSDFNLVFENSKHHINSTTNYLNTLLRNKKINVFPINSDHFNWRENKKVIELLVNEINKNNQY